MVDPNDEEVKRLVVDVVGDSNHIDRQTGVDKLMDHGPTVAVPVLIEVLLDRGRTVPYWDDVVEGLCRFLWEADSRFAGPCAPAIVHLLATLGNVTSPDPIFLLDVLDTTEGTQDTSFAIPTLLDLIRSHKGDEVASTALKLLNKYSREQLRQYQHMVDELCAQ